jgi:Electron transfer DM13
MNVIRRYRWLVIGGLAVLVVGAFLAFRPDKLFVDDAVDETLAEAFTTTQATPVTTSTTMPASSTTPGASQPGDPSTTTSSTTTAPQGPTAIATGTFSGIDHSATGTATVYEQGGTSVLRFEDDTDIQNGPDLYVWLLASDNYDGGAPDAHLDLGKIKGNVGGQNYELPGEYDRTVHRVVLVWCKRFAVPFAAAPLA